MVRNFVEELRSLVREWGRSTEKGVSGMKSGGG